MQFGLSEYAQVESAKKAEREADVVSSLSNARSQLAEGKVERCVSVLQSRETKSRRERIPTRTKTSSGWRRTCGNRRRVTSTKGSKRSWQRTRLLEFPSRGKDRPVSAAGRWADAV